MYPGLRAEHRAVSWGHDSIRLTFTRCGAGLGAWAESSPGLGVVDGGILEIVIELRSTGVGPVILESVRGLLREYSVRGNGLCVEIPTGLVMQASKAQIRCMPMY